MYLNNKARRIAHLNEKNQDGWEERKEEAGLRDGY
jgi:hypothetical protein